MTFELTDEQREIQRLVRDFADGEVRPVAEELDREKRFPYEIVEKLGKLGLMGIPYPQELGGGGADTVSYALAVEELARVDSSVAVTVAAHTSLGTYPIVAFGSDRLRERWLPELCSGRRLAAFGLTEPGSGSDARAMGTAAREEGGEWVIDGAKQFITNAGTDVSGCVTIAARTGDGEISNILVPNGTPGYTVEEAYRKMGWNASDTRPLVFDGCRVPAENLVGERGGGYRQFLETLAGGRISVSAMGVGLAQGALDQALAYAGERHAFGRPISQFQAIQVKLADLSTEIEAARLLTYRAAALKDSGADYGLAAAQAKLKTGRLAVRAADEAVQVHGGYGYIEEYPVCRFYRDAKILTIGEGTDEVQQLLIARALGM
ncbi:MAG TPA: acyl-CoA dehydrogenase family protein [Thermoleophilaceae bacterium]|nr:acyl-CoA dehydrogenase family protein [Thermoleophilaceae bacterium]